MAHWRGEYAAALAARDRHEKANVTIYNAYTKLADRTASTAVETPDTPATASQQSIAPAPVADPRQQAPLVQGPSPQNILSTTRADLAEAQRSRTELQERLARATTELERLRKRNSHDAKRINSMEGEIANLQLRLRDRDEELKGKAKLLEEFQDELAALNLQINMAEQREERLQRENHDLVDRWMAKMGVEADAMNDASRFS